jgi:hypothetical protein
LTIPKFFVLIIPNCLAVAGLMNVTTKRNRKMRDIIITTDNNKLKGAKKRGRIFTVNKGQAKKFFR